MISKTSQRACAALLGLLLTAACHGYDAAEKQLECERGEAQSCFELGIAYSLGHGVEMDTGLGASLMRRSAELGHGLAQLNLGSMYEGETFGRADPVEAYAWYGLSAAAGEPLAQEALARLSEQLSPEQLVQGQRRIDDYRAKLAARSAADAG